MTKATSTRLSLPAPWRKQLALARSLLYLQAGLTLAIAPSWAIFTPAAGDERAVHCDGTAALSFFCASHGVSADHLSHGAGLLLIAFASGFLPALTALPAAWILVSIPLSGTIIDGGDQLAGILGVLILPASLLDWRLSVWTNGLPTPARWPVAILLGNVSWWLMRAQIVVVYAEASLGKLHTDDWAQGKALYEWVRNPLFGAPDWLSPPVFAATSSPLLTATATYGVMALEFAVAVSLLVPRRVRIRFLFPAAALLHIAIIFIMGVSSFSLVMFAALIILVLPMDHDGFGLSRTNLLRRATRKATTDADIS